MINRIEYFDTHGKSIEKYCDYPIYILPMETIEIIINQNENLGGTGGNFIFDWLIKSNGNKPLFECVMISTLGQQGLSFISQGIEINR